MLIANDGSTAEIPNDKNLKTIFGLAKGSKLNTIESPARASVNGFYDPLNNIMLISEIDKFDKREKDFLTSNIDKLIELMGKRKLLLIFDRGYICTELLILLEEKGVKYVFRTPNTFFKHEIKKLNCNDGIIDLKLTYNRVAKFKVLDKEKYIDKTINVRSVSIELDTGEIEYLITNLNSEEVKYEEMSDLYISRWGIEKSFDILKNKLQIENIGSKTENGVKQEFYACILLYNFLEDIKNQMNKDIDNNKGNKYEYKINMNVLVGTLKNNLLKIINNTDNIDEEISLIYKEIRRNLVAVKPDRKNPRNKKRSSNKYKTNLRRSF